jgi:hypothetical protein
MTEVTIDLLYDNYRTGKYDGLKLSISKGTFIGILRRYMENKVPSADMDKELIKLGTYYKLQREIHQIDSTKEPDLQERYTKVKAGTDTLATITTDTRKLLVI